ncbi:regulatory protein RecX [uncultured Treponema sp.]|uniref:regulatory protein RecX n=1 Tax=uncultured Treponema sp. TaxID=162155 RepID=UPI0025E4F2E7|nr:regulatory protein RecX [uncultured Treponema sp.]
MYEITPSVGSAFFLRSCYLSLLSEENLFAGAEFSDEEASDLLNAAVVYGAEFAAMTYLARAEHCRAGLERKFLKKGIEKSAVKKALDYLEQCGNLSDERFAGAWLRSRSIDHAEGRIRLAAELASRGVDRVASKKALDEFFSEKDELEICRRAYKKCRLFKNDLDKIKASLVQKGFTLKQIGIVVSEEDSYL